MKNKWLPHIRYLFLWVLLFLIGKAIFLAYHYDKSAALSFGEILKIFAYGLRLDISFAAYLSVLPFLFFLIRSLAPFRLYPGLGNYTGFLILIFAALTAADLELYRSWGFRLDATPLQYLSTPGEMLASMGNAPIVLLVFVFLLLVGVGYYMFRYLFRQEPPLSLDRDWGYVGYCLFLFAALILPIRGGWQQIPLNQSDVYFSEKAFANHAAVNVPWNLVYSITKRNYDQKNPYEYLPGSLARSLVQNMYQKPEGPGLAVLKNHKPNVLFIILESYTGKLVGCLGGEPGVTPNLDKIAREGILFDSLYASGDRSEKGLVALLSGYPVQTTTSIIKTPRKTETLPHLNAVLEAQGYASSYFYGGELAFANIKSYLLNAGYNKLVSKFDFDPKDYNSKWGVHDHLLFDRVLEDLRQEKQPFFSTVFTLSSHEPYDVPIPARFKGRKEATLFKNSIFYTDQALGKFWEAAQNEPWWENTLVVLVADHGHRLPGGDANDAPAKFRIPLILAGGALTQRGMVISTIGSHTDVVPTLLTQLGLPTIKFAWGKNLLHPQAPSFAFYVFNDGFGLITPRGKLTFDNVAKKVLQKDPGIEEEQIRQGQAYMQYSFGDFLKR